MTISRVPLTFYALFSDGSDPMATTSAASLWDVVAEAGQRVGKTPVAVAWWEVDTDDEMEVMAAREDDLRVSVRAERMEGEWVISWELFQDAPDVRVTVAMATGGDRAWEGRTVAKLVMWQALCRLVLGSPKTWAQGGDPLTDEG